MIPQNIKKSISIGMIFFFIIPVIFANQFFIDVNGNFNFPFDSNSERNYGFGGGGKVAFGYSLGSADFSLKAGYSYSQSNQLIISASEPLVGLGAGFNLDNRLIPAFPEFLGFKLEASVFADFYKIKHYKTYSLKDRNLSDESKGVTVLPSVSFSVLLPNLIKTDKIDLIPSFGYEVILHCDKTGVISSNQIFLGIKINFSKNESVSEPEEESVPEIPENTILLFR